MDACGPHTVVLGMWLDWRHADAGVGIGMPALVGPSWREGVGKRKREGVGKRKTENEKSIFCQIIRIKISKQARLDPY